MVSRFITRFKAKASPRWYSSIAEAATATLWDNQVPVFSKNYRVVTIDLPGHGESGQGRKNWSVESFADDINTVITKLNLKRAVLVGSSMGGPIAVEATRRRPGRVQAIVPVDTLQNVETKVDPAQLEQVFKQLRADYKGAITGFLNQLVFAPNTPAAVKNRIISEVTSRPPELSIAILEGILGYNSVPALREIKVPIRAINGDLNPTNLEVNRKYAPQFDAVIIKGSGQSDAGESGTFQRIANGYTSKSATRTQVISAAQQKITSGAASPTTICCCCSCYSDLNAFLTCPGGYSGGRRR